MIVYPNGTRHHPGNLANEIHDKRVLYRINNPIENKIPDPKIEEQETKNGLPFYMDGYLKSNLDLVPSIVKKDWDAVIIVSGTGLVRSGKSYFASQIAWYVAHILNEERKKKGLVPQDNPVPFTLDNVFFSADELMDKAPKLPMNSVILFDEARAGLDSISSNSTINKSMQDFFSRCGFLNHIFILVLPDFFQLNQTTAVARSLFLVNVYVTKDLDRGYFTFFNKATKEKLYIYGKKKIGAEAKYFAVNSNFYGRFTDHFTLDEKEYKKKKLDSFEKSKQEKDNKFKGKWCQQRDACIWILKREVKLTQQEISDKLKFLLRGTDCPKIVAEAIERVDKMIEEGFYNDPLKDNQAEND
jgi:hypothetical protein